MCQGYTQQLTEVGVVDKGLCVGYMQQLTEVGVVDKGLCVRGTRSS